MTYEIALQRIKKCKDNEDIALDLSKLKLSKLPPELSELRLEYLFINDNNLSTLRGCPKEVNGDFYCCDNELTTLNGCPRIVKGTFNCDNNKIKTLKGSPKFIGEDFSIINNELISLKYCTKNVGCFICCRGNPLVDLKNFKGAKEDKIFFY